MRRQTGAAILLAALLLASGGAARADDARLDAARAHSQEGDAYYKLEKYANAITEYEQAYLAKPDPSFLYNIAQCHRLMGQGTEAINFYRRFLKDAPNAPNRAIAEKHIHDLEDAAARGAPPAPATTTPPSPGPAAAAPTPVTPLPSPPSSAAPALDAPPPTSTPVSTTPTVENVAPSPPSESPPFYSRWWFWTSVGAVVVGGVVLAVVLSKHDPSCREGYTCQVGN